MLLGKLAEHRDDPRRGALLCGIVATLETQADAIRAAMPKEVAAKDVDELMGMLYTVSVPGRHKNLSSGVLKEKLHAWRQGS
jgi:hypothetical protein